MIVTSNVSLCESTNHIRLLLLHFGHARVGRDWVGTQTVPGASRLYFVTKGQAEIRPSGGEALTLSGGKWYLLPAGCSFDFSCEKEMEHFYFHLKICDLDGLDLLSAFPLPAELLLAEDQSRFFLDCIQSEDIADGLRLRHALESVLLSFLSEHRITIENTKFSPTIVKAIKYIKRHLSAQLTIPEIAEHVFVSNSTLTKRFKSELSKSVGEYINDIIMFEASQLLLKSGASILAISEKFGFSDQFYFSRRFKEKFGMSPMKYRKTFVM